MNNDQKVLKELKTKYPEINFRLIRNEYLIELIFDDKSKEDDEEFKDEIFYLCERELSEDDLYLLAITYDYGHRITTNCIETCKNVKLPISVIIDKDEQQEVVTKLFNIKYNLEKKTCKSFGTVVSIMDSIDKKFKKVKNYSINVKPFESQKEKEYKKMILLGSKKICGVCTH